MGHIINGCDANTHAFLVFLLQLLIKLDEAISKGKGVNATAVAGSPGDVAAAAGPSRPDATAAAAGATGPGSTPARQHLHVHMLPWPADQLPTVELLTLLFWLQQHAVRLQLAPGGCADLYLDPDFDVYVAVKVPVLAMQSRPTLISGGVSTQAGECGLAG
jgi:hypothetical protein